MEKQFKVDPKGQYALSKEEMQRIVGGSLAETLVKLAMQGAEYFFRMGVREGRRMKSLL